MGKQNAGERRDLRIKDGRGEFFGLAQAMVPLARLGDGPRVVMVSGVEGGEGASTVARNLAEVFAAEFGRPVCLVRLDEAQSGVSLPADPAPDALANGHDRPAGEVILAALSRRDLAAALDVGVSDSLRRMTQYAEFFVMDGPPLLASIDAARLCGDVDGVVMVVEAERTALSDVDAARDMVAACGGTLIGGVLNKRRRRLPEVIARMLGGWRRARLPAPAAVRQTPRPPPLSGEGSG